MSIDRPGSGADTPVVDDRFSETGLKLGRDLSPVSEQAGRNFRMSPEEAFAGAAGGLKGAAELSDGTPPGHRAADADTGDTGRGGEGAAAARDDGAASVDAGDDSAAAAGNAGGDAVSRAETGTSEVGGVDAGGLGEGTGSGDDGLAGAGPDGPGAPGPWERPGTQAVEGTSPGVAVRDTGAENVRGAVGDVTSPGPGVPADSANGARADSRDHAGTDDAGAARRPDGGEETDSGARARPEGERREGTALRDATESEGGESPAPKQKEQPREQDSATEVSLGQPGETGLEAAPDAHADDQRPVSAAEMKAAFADMMAENNTKLEELKAEHKAETEDLKAEYEAKLDSVRNEYKDKISDLTARLDAVETRPQPVPDQPVNDGEEQEPSDLGYVTTPDEHMDIVPASHMDADVSRTDAESAESRLHEESERDVEQELSERPGSGLDEAGQQALGLVGAVGLVNPVVQLALTADSARRTYNELPPDDKYRANNLMDTVLAASGGMPPEMAVLAVTASAVAPMLHGTVQSVFHKFRRKE